jgi:hypothetical protein
MKLHDLFGAISISHVWIFTALAGINVEQHSTSVVICSTALDISRIGVYESFVIAFIFLSRVIILLYSNSHG